MPLHRAQIAFGEQSADPPPPRPVFRVKHDIRRPVRKCDPRPGDQPETLCALLHHGPQARIRFLRPLLLQIMIFPRPRPRPHLYRRQAGPVVQVPATPEKPAPPPPPYCGRRSRGRYAPEESPPAPSGPRARRRAGRKNSSPLRVRHSRGWGGSWAPPFRGPKGIAPVERSPVRLPSAARRRARGSPPAPDTSNRGASALAGAECACQGAGRRGPICRGPNRARDSVAPYRFGLVAHAKSPSTYHFGLPPGSPYPPSRQSQNRRPALSSTR